MQVDRKFEHFYLIILQPMLLAICLTLAIFLLPDQGIDKYILAFGLFLSIFLQ
jgi:hypothetical protein